MPLLQTIWPFGFLLLPLIITLLGGRTAWLWLSVALGVIALNGVLHLSLWQLAHGGGWSPVTSILLSTQAETGYHDTYYVISNIGSVMPLVVPSLLIAGLYFAFPQHPRRAPLDIGLFWAATILLICSYYAFTLLVGFGLQSMPRRYVEYSEAFTLTHKISGLTVLLAYLIKAWAALRPLRSWWTQRKAR